MGHGGPGNVFGCGILAVHAWGKVNAGLAKKMLDECGAIHGAFARQQVRLGAQAGIAEGHQRANQFAQ